MRRSIERGGESAASAGKTIGANAAKVNFGAETVSADMATVSTDALLKLARAGATIATPIGNGAG